MWSWFKRAVDTVSTDKFRIKVITLKDGTKKYYPQYKGEVSSSYLCIIRSKDALILTDVSDYQLVNGMYWHCVSEVEATALVDAFKHQLTIERSKELESEEIIKL